MTTRVYTVPMLNPMESAKKAGITAAISAGGSYLLGENGNLSVMGMDIPMPIVFALTGAVASFTADLSHVYVIPKLGLNPNLSNLEVVAANGVSGGVGFVLASQLVPGMGSEGMTTRALFGAGSVVLGDMIYNLTMNKDVTSDLF